MSGPLVFGVVFDSACILWQKGCGALGTCWVTDNDVLTYRFFILFMIVQVVAYILFSCSYLLNEKLAGESAKVESKIPIIGNEEKEQEAKLPSQSNEITTLDHKANDVSQLNDGSPDVNSQLIRTKLYTVSHVKYQSTDNTDHGVMSYDNPVSTDDKR